MSQAITLALIERTFLQTLVDDLGEVVILDGIDELEDGYRIRSHDLRGPLPEIFIAHGTELSGEDLQVVCGYPGGAGSRPGGAISGIIVEYPRGCRGPG